MEMEEKIRYAVEHTELIRSPRQELATFGSSIIDYYVVTELAGNVSVVRDGRVIAERPKIITPAYLVNMEGFSEQAKRYIGMIAREYPNEPGIFYRYKNEPKDMNVISEPIDGIISKLNEQIDKEDNPLSTIIKGIEEMWDVSLFMFIYGVTRKSFGTNVTEFRSRGFLDIDSSGVPGDARRHIEQLFDQVARDVSQAPDLIAELNRWGVFQEYQDRFFSLFRRR